ncbi:MAG: DUF4190 domain-containing protein [Planctomycetes bacterium]|nr:DUF4190 domain-containing protein [Planctomycetota bacterium]
MRPHRGAMILVFGILGIVICLIFGIVAWVMGNGDLAAMREGTMDASGEGLTQAGKICGIISVVLACLGACTGIVLLVVMLAAGGVAAAGGAAVLQ